MSLNLHQKKMRTNLVIFFILSYILGVESQVVEIFTGRKNVGINLFDSLQISVKELKEGPILFGKGLFDYNVNGQIAANVQVLKIRIGEPKGFSIPFYLLTGATSTTFGDSKDNESTVADLISPTGGFINGFFNGYIHLLGAKEKVTALESTFSIGGRMVSGKNKSENIQEIFGAAYLDVGFLFQTGAWEADNNYVDGGVFWAQMRYAATIASKSKLEAVFGENMESPAGLRFELGILIQDKVNIKLGGYIPQAGKSLPTLDKTAWKIAFDYKVSK
jgi:hypothetical protein